METKYLWDIIDKLRDELRDMKKENDTLDSSLKECVNEYNKLEKENDYDGLKKKYDYLKLAIVDQNDDIKTLKKENDKLKDEAVKWNRKYNKLTDDYNNDIGASYELDDKHIDIIKGLEEHVEVANNHIVDLEEEIKSIKLYNKHYPKDYNMESKEYFEHNPNQSKVWFYMLDEYDMKNATNGGLLLDEDNALCMINNPH